MLLRVSPALMVWMDDMAASEIKNPFEGYCRTHPHKVAYLGKTQEDQIPPPVSPIQRRASASTLLASSIDPTLTVTSSPDECSRASRAICIFTTVDEVRWAQQVTPCCR